MRFIVDAQLPQRLAAHLTALGHDTIHVNELPRAGDTSDAEISAFADGEQRIVVTKDIDFADSHLSRGTPRPLLRIVTGNIKNADLLALVERHLDAIERGFAAADHVELSRTALVVHTRAKP